MTHTHAVDWHCEWVDVAIVWWWFQVELDLIRWTSPMSMTLLVPLDGPTSSIRVASFLTDMALKLVCLVLLMCSGQVAISLVVSIP